jgi:hypothetical protein
MFYTIYKITNKINDKTYIGKHQTKNLDDGYMGSGNYIKRAIKKHGIDNFMKEILHVFDNELEMNLVEKELVILGETSYNICPGGQGGFGYINVNGLNWSQEKNEKISGFKKLTTEQRKIYSSMAIEKIKILNKSRKGISKKTPQLQTKESREKRLIGIRSNPNFQKGIFNSQYGSFWITNGINNKKIKTLDTIPELWYKGRTIKQRSIQ